MSAIPAGYKLTEVGVIPKHWEVSCLQDVCERVGVGLATSVTKYYRQTGVPIIRNMNIKDGYFDGADMLYLCEDFAKANSSKAAKAFDVLTVHTGSNLGQTCVLPAEFDACQTFTTLITTPKKSLLDPTFLCLHMSSAVGRGEMDRLQVGGGKGNLNTGDLKRYRIARPPVAEQRAIAAALADVDALLAKLDQCIAKKRDLKQAAMQQLLTGQTRLPGFSGEWEMKRLGDIGTFLKGSGIKKDEARNGDIPCVRYGEIYTHHDDYVKAYNSWISSAVAATATPLKQGDLLFAGSGETKVSLQPFHINTLIHHRYPQTFHKEKRCHHQKHDEFISKHGKPAGCLRRLIAGNMV